MSDRTISRLGLALATLLVCVTPLNAFVVYLSETAPNPTRPYDALGATVETLTALTFTLVGGVLTFKRPRNLVGWAMMLAGTGSTLGDLLSGYAKLGLIYRPEENLAGSVLAAALGEGNWTALMCGVFLLLLLFPLGRVPSRRWRTIAPLAVAGFAVSWFAISTSPDNLEAPLDAYSSPIAFTESDVYFLLIIPIIAFCLLSTAAAGIDLLVRFRRSRGEERLQYKWLATAAGLLIFSMPFAAASNYTGVGGAMISVALIALPISIGVAILRYRLYDIDRIINRTLVYGALTAGLALTYFGLVVGLQEALSAVSGGSDLAVVLTTLVVAALFLPARRYLQRTVDRRFNRRAFDGAQTVDAFSARLREQVDLDTLRYELLALVDETVAPSEASLWLRTKKVP